MGISWGRFALGKFQSLSRDHLQFAELFIKNRSNIKEMERELGVSYPTVRSRLEFSKCAEKEGVDLDQLFDMIQSGTEGKLVDVIDSEEREHVEVHVE